MRSGDGFAIRTRRESAAQVRNVLLPESAFVDIASFTDEENLFLVSNVPQITRDELSQALTKTG